MTEIVQLYAAIGQNLERFRVKTYFFQSLRPWRSLVENAMPTAYMITIEILQLKLYHNTIDK